MNLSKIFSDKKIWIGFSVLFVLAAIGLVWGSEEIKQISEGGINRILAPTKVMAPEGIVSNPEGDIVTIRPEPVTSYLENPGIGLQYDQSVSNPLVQETVSYLQREDISWDVINPDEGVYRWEILDEAIQAADAQGKQISFRIYTMRGESFGGHRLPQWVMNKGATLFSTGDPNYHSCIYQDEWGKFVDALRVRYDGNPTIAFIDISGYGAFNEWNWNDAFTQWDYEWEEAYLNGIPSPATMSTIDSQSWRRLVDTFAGGSFGSHDCLDQRGQIQNVSYRYTGFQSTQLVMPYAGIRQATQYAFSKGLRIGFRYDCLGAVGDYNLFEKVGYEINQTWPTAPVIFEFCNPMDFSTVDELLLGAHPSLVHSNAYIWGNQAAVIDLLIPIGYRYQLSKMSYLTNISQSVPWQVKMVWQNVGYAPNYPKMGQKLSLHAYLSDLDGKIVTDFKIDAELSAWLPADPVTADPPDNRVEFSVSLPQSVQPGKYQILIGIIDERTQLPINLAIEGKNDSGFYRIGELLIQ